MRFVKGIWVGAERLEASLGAEIDRPTAILEARKIGGIGVTEDSSAEADKARTFFLLEGIVRHTAIVSAELPR